MACLIKEARIVNNGKTFEGDLLIKNDRIERIDANINVDFKLQEIAANGKHLIPGIIDDQVHFREPGLTHKANIATESRAAVAGGVTSFMDMPNVKPASLTQSLLEERYQIASKTSAANYSFYMGVSNDNLDEVLKTDKNKVCGVKVFMGSSTGNMLVDDEHVLSKLFAQSDCLIATHCEDEATIKTKTQECIDLFGEEIPFFMHPKIRSEEACYLSSSKAVALAKKHGTRLHVLHISTADEIDLFDNQTKLTDKRITSEVCVHHLYFDAGDYEKLGGKIKCNPSIKDKHHKEKLLQALLNNQLDIIATDHAPHTLEEKNNTYLSCPSGLPLVQHALNLMLTFYHEGKISLERIVEKMCHAPAQCFQIRERGFLHEGFKADMALVDVNAALIPTKANILYKCDWSPLENYQLKGKVLNTFVNGKMVYNGKEIIECPAAERLLFH